MTGRTFRLFVYGLSRKGERQHERLEGARFVGPALTEARYALVDLTIYPALIGSGNVSVVGEVYEVDPKLRFELDVYHQCPVLFQRESVELIDQAPADAYVMRPQQVGGKRRIWNGDWCQRFVAKRRAITEQSPYALRARRTRRVR